jgi:predicted ATPase
LEKLAASGEHDSVAARHANFLIQLLEANPIDPFELGSSNSLADSVRDCLENLGAAFEWSFGPNGSERHSNKVSGSFRAAISGHAAAF